MISIKLSGELLKPFQSLTFMIMDKLTWLRDSQAIAAFLLYCHVGLVNKCAAKRPKELLDRHFRE